MRVAQRRGIRRAIVAVARRLAVVLHRCGSMVASSAGARTALLFLRLLEPAAENQEIADKEIRVLLRQKNVLTGTTGGVSSQGR
jgi:acid phosphatase family membrane protein YuiD